MKFFRRKAIMIKELRCLLIAAEEFNQTLQIEVQQARDENVALTVSLQEASDFSKSIQEKMDQTTAELQAEMAQNKQDGQDALDEKDKQIQELNEILLRIQEENNMIKINVKEITESMLRTQTQQQNQIHLLQETLSVEIKGNQDLQEQVCRLQSESTNLQGKLDIQTQLYQHQSKDLQMCQRDLKEMNDNNECLEDLMELKNDKISSLAKALVQTKANLANQQQDTRNALDQAAQIQDQLSNEMEQNNGLRGQVDALKADLEKSEQQVKKCTEEKMEEIQKNQQMENELTEKEKLILHLQSVIANFQTEREAMKVDLQSVKAAMVCMEQNMDQIKDLFENELEVKEQQNRQLQNDLSITKKQLEQQSQDHLKEIQTMTEAQKSMEQAMKQAEKNTKDKEKSMKDALKEKDAAISSLQKENEQLQKDVQTLTQTCQISQEAKIVDENMVNYMNMVNQRMETELMEVVQRQNEMDKERVQMELKCAALQNELDMQRLKHQQEIQSLNQALQMAVNDANEAKISLQQLKDTNDLCRRQTSQIQATNSEGFLNQTEMENLQITIGNNNNQSRRVSFGPATTFPQI